MVTAESFGCPLDASVVVEAARKGDVGMLKWLRNHGKDWDVGATCVAAAASGNSEALMYVRLSSWFVFDSRLGSFSTLVFIF